MAKKGSRTRTAAQGATRSRTVVDFAEDLGRLLGTAQAKASNWMNQRRNVIDELTQLRDTANQLLRDLTGGAQTGATRGGGARKAAGSASATGPAAAGTGARKRGGRKPMSAAARKEVSQRMRRYWAARRREKAAKAG
jgi:hypothetical protein